MGVVGLLLAAGAGRRMGRPKALVEGADGTPWAVSASRALAEGGCEPVVVVVGADAATVCGLLTHEPVSLVESPHWDEGMGASLRAGLEHLVRSGCDADAALVHLVDLPDVGADVVARVVEHASPASLARASFATSGPGHPVLLGREHWRGVLASADGDRGARDYLGAHDVTEVDCSDLASGVDVDTPPST
ncbi:nucleotidyltransferase family protein [Solicola sp. PLA-1-18]|uniref:nucleotidyltransferase family protein n=1 Tax=Solicola sp. PLA-1-18 TaxID=3380532 RepID=UPI003B79E80A